MSVLPDLAEIARQESVRLSIEIDGPRGTVIIKDSRGGQTWVDSYRYLDAMTIEKHGTAVALAGKLWASLCKSRGVKDLHSASYASKRETAYGLAAAMKSLEAPKTLVEHLEQTVEIGHRLLENLG